MSTIHTAMTGKTDSLIDAVRESEIDECQWEIDVKKATDAYHEWLIKKQDPTHPDHPDYMRMVVHQMD